MGLGENGKIAFAYKSHDAGTWNALTESYSGPDPTDSVKIKSSWIAGEYAIGAMTAYVGIGRTKIQDSSKVGVGMVGSLRKKLLMARWSSPNAGYLVTHWP